MTLYTFIINNYFRSLVMIPALLCTLRKPSSAAKCAINPLSCSLDPWWQCQCKLLCHDSHIHTGTGMHEHTKLKLT